MAFVSSPSSTNEVNIAYGVSTDNTQVSSASTKVITASTQVSTANLRRAPNIVEPELRTIVAPMAEHTMEELLRAPTEGYGEAIVLPEINADYFEIKMNLLQLVQANPFYCRETYDVSIFARRAFKIGPAAVSGKPAKTSVRRNEHNLILDLARPLVEIVLIIVRHSASVKAVEESCVTCGGAHSWYNCPATDNNQASVCATTGTYNQVNPSNRVSNQMAPPGFAPVQNNGQNRFNQNQVQGNNFNRGNNFHGNQGFHAQNNHAPNVQNQGFQNQPFQMPNNQVQQEISNDFFKLQEGIMISVEKYAKSNLLVERSWKGYHTKKTENNAKK
ncbi:hypothetical protein Tco_0608391 [Tanacetum coccineum]